MSEQEEPATTPPIEPLATVQEARDRAARESWGSTVTFALVTTAAAWGTGVLMSLLAGVDQLGVQQAMVIATILGLPMIAILLPLARRRRTTGALVRAALLAFVAAAVLTALILWLLTDSGLAPVLLALLLILLATPTWVAAAAALAAALGERTPSPRLRRTGTIVAGAGALVLLGGLVMLVDLGLTRDQGARALVIHGLALAALGGALRLRGTGARD